MTAAEKTALFRQRHPERFTAEARREARQREYAKHGEAMRAKSQQWRREHPGTVKQQVKAWREKNEVTRTRYLHGRVAKEARRRARHNGGVKLKPAEILEMLEAQSWRCAYCPSSLRAVPYQLDHRTPISRGGQTVRENLCMSCASCNARKNVRTADEFQAATERTG